MKISIVGCGKMGHEIMEIFLDSDYEIVWLARNEEKEQEYINFISKKLKRIARKEGWSKEETERRRNKVSISFCVNDLTNSNFVIETIVEELKIKEELFKKIQYIVDDECILLTNTSSISLESIFKNVIKKDRCAGLHFFYPCKMINFVEINCFEKTENKYIDKVKILLENADRKYIVLQKEANLIFSKIINVLMSETYNIYSENILSYKQIDEIIKEKFMMMGVFEIFNSTGNKIIFNCLKNFVDKEDELFHKKFKDLVVDIHTNYNDCEFDKFIGKTGNCCENEQANLKQNDIYYEKYVLLRIQSFYLNYITYIVNKLNVNKDELIEACKDILGIIKEPKEMLTEIGENNISNILSENYNKINCNLYKMQDIGIWM